MAEVVKEKRIFQIAKELNISHLEIMSFLKNKDKEVTSHMAPVSPDIYDEILLEFSKDKQQNERYRKEQARKKVISEIRKKESEEVPVIKQPTVTKIKTAIKDNELSLSLKLKHASEKLKKDRDAQDNVYMKEDEIASENESAINDIPKKSTTSP